MESSVLFFALVAGTNNLHIASCFVTKKNSTAKDTVSTGVTKNDRKGDNDGTDSAFR